MAELHKGTTLTPSKLDLLTGWMGAQRWYAAKGCTPRLESLAAWRLGDPDGAVGIETHLVHDTGGPEPVTYQVPLTYRDAPVDGLEPALVGTMEHGVLGRRWVYDATHDPVYARQLLALILARVRAESSSASDTLDDRFVPADPAGGPDLTVTGSRVLVGEQSNTSIIIDTVDADGTPRPVIVKVFRTIADGENPDVVLQSALRAAGCDRVPDVVGAVLGSWPLPGGNGTAHGHLAFAQEFIPGSEDAWRVALRAARTGTDFTTAARDLGATTALVHTLLAQSLPTQPPSRADIDRITAVMRRRLAAASELVPAIAERAAEIESVFRAAEDATWPVLQRIHGDYHLGQVLHSPDRGWLLLDFEGEPLRPLAERTQPDSAFRDIAGMVRSLDYAGGSVEQEDPTADARAWVDNGVTAFLEGYTSHGDDPRRHDPLLCAFLLDKALYEVVYEARNRPSWLAIPVAAINRLLDSPGAARPEPLDERGPSA
ncbi:MAG TPA: phosphotransferase [Intrasporangiaceae bacterium]|nr:phosphotransferase [Intrasporangiaceae bacterium]